MVIVIVSYSMGGGTQVLFLCLSLFPSRGPKRLVPFFLSGTAKSRQPVASATLAQITVAANQCSPLANELSEPSTASMSSPSACCESVG